MNPETNNESDTNITAPINSKSRVLLTVLTSFAIVIFYQLAGGLLSILFEGASQMVIQIVAQTVFLLVPTAVAIKASGDGLARMIGLGQVKISRNAFLAFVGISLCILVVQGQINLQDALVPESMVEGYNNIKEFFDGEYSALLGAPHFMDILLAAIGACAIPAISEELLFRGYLLGALASRFSVRTSVVVSALIFALIHFHPVNFVALFAIGVLLCLLRIRTGSLIAPIMAHFLNNAFSVATYYADYPSQASGETTIAWYISLPMMAAGIVLIILFLRWDARGTQG